MAKAKHTVEILEDFTQPIGALIVDGRELRPSTEFKNHKGERAAFGTKPAAMAYCKAHGDKVRYLGKI